MFFELMKEGILKILNPSLAYQNFEVAIGAEIVVLLQAPLSGWYICKKKWDFNRTLLVEACHHFLIALIIFYNSFELVKENAKVLLGMSPSDEFYESVKDTYLKIDRVEGIHDIVGVYTGEDSVHLDMHVTLTEA